MLGCTCRPCTVGLSPKLELENLELLLQISKQYIVMIWKQERRQSRGRGTSSLCLLLVTGLLQVVRHRQTHASTYKLQEENQTLAAFVQKKLLWGWLDKMKRKKRRGGGILGRNLSSPAFPMHTLSHCRFIYFLIFFIDFHFWLPTHIWFSGARQGVRGLP